MTAAACLEITREWLLSEYGLVARSASVVLRDDGPWLEFVHLCGEYQSPGEEPIATLRAPLCRRRIEAEDSVVCHSGVLIIQLYEADPTPIYRQIEEGVTEIQTPLPWAEVAIVYQRDGLEARSFDYIAPRWGATAAWPFAD